MIWGWNQGRYKLKQLFEYDNEYVHAVEPLLCKYNVAENDWASHTVITISPS